MDKGFTEFEDWRDEILNAEDEERRKLDKKIAQEQDWVRYGVTARRKRNMGRLRKLQSLRQERRDQRQATGLADMSLTGATRSGQRLFVAKNIAKAYDGRPIVADLSMTVMRGDKIGLVGPNGAGKTTLVNLLLGRLAPDSGSIKFGTDIEANYIDQTREGLDPEMPLRQAISPSGGDQITVGNATKHVAGYLKDFLFSPEQFNTPVGALSGGERARVLLGRAFAMPANVLVLDEPTNDLDLETLDLLAEIIADYDGTLILVSHDRDFLDRTVTTTLVAEGDGQWGEYPGGYSDMVTQRGLPPVGDGPAPTSRSKKTKAEPAKAPKNKGKLSFREKHDLETLPRRVQEIEREVGILGRELADPRLYAKNPKRFDKLTADIARLEAEKAAAEERWLEVEMKREEMEGG